MRTALLATVSLALAMGGALAADPAPVLRGSWRADDIPTCGDFSPDGKLLAFGTELGTLTVIDLERRAPLPPVAAHPGGNGVSSIRFAPDGRHVFTGAWEKGAVKSWTLPGLAAGVTFQTGGSRPVDQLAVSRDGRYLIAKNEDTVVFDLGTGKEKQRIHGATAISFDGHRNLFLGTENDGLTRVDVETGTTTGSGPELKSARIVRLLAVPDLDELFALTEQGELLGLDPAKLQVRSRRALEKIPGFPPVPPTYGAHAELAWFPGPQRLLVNDRTVSVLFDRAGTAATPVDHRSSVGFVMSPAGPRFAILGGIQNPALSPGEKQHYWTVNVLELPR